mgnify:CR=1 FL=1
MVFKRRDRRSIISILMRFFWPKGGWKRAFHYVNYRLRRLPDSSQKISRGIWAGLFATFINPMELWESVNIDGTPKDTSFFFAATSLISNGNESDFCVYMTKQALDFGTVPEWFQARRVGMKGRNETDREARFTFLLVVVLWLLAADPASVPAPMAHLLQYRDLDHECLWPRQLMAILVPHNHDQL